VNLERPIASLVRDLLRETFDIDGRVLRTLTLLYRKPGELTREFLAGRRSRYTPPLRLYLVISIAFFVVVSWFASRGVLLDPGQDPERDAMSQAEFLSNELPRLMFLLLPVFALLVKAANRDRLYIDHLVFSLHLHSAAFILLALILPLERISSKSGLALSFQVSVFLYLLAYIVLSIRRVYAASWKKASRDSLIILLGYLAIVTLLIENTSNILVVSD